MKFEELEDLARKLLREDERMEAQRKPAYAVAENVRSLAMDPRFAGVVALVMRNLKAFQEAGCSQTLAGNHGLMAHGQGSVLALQQLLRNLEAMSQERSRVRGGARKPEEAEEG